MREFFRGWKRKAGVATLVMACVLMSLWVRSEVAEDTITIPHRYSVYKLMSGGGIFGCYSNWDSTDPDFGSFYEFDWTPKSSINGHWHGMYDTSLQQAGFNYEFLPAKNDGSENSEYGALRFTVPYWVVAMPLTGLSAYLLLSNPRTKNRTDDTER